VAISGSNDGTVRVWDLATGSPVGDPFTGHSDWVTAVAAAELEGRPVAISGSGDGTVRVWDLATGSPVGDPFTGHSGAVRSVAAAELESRPVVITGSSDATLRVWDLATGSPVGDLFTGHGGAVQSIALWMTHGPVSAEASACLCAGTGNVAQISLFSAIDDNDLLWQNVAVLEVGSNVLTLRWASSRVLVIGTELGIVVIDLSIVSLLRAVMPARNLCTVSEGLASFACPEPGPPVLISTTLPVIGRKAEVEICNNTWPLIPSGNHSSHSYG
jgi:WD40 repeat protein